MSDLSPILDYASPRPRRRLRLPAKSVLDVRVDPDGLGVTIVEKLAGIPQAVAGMIFAVFVLIIAGAMAWISLRTVWVKHHEIDAFGAILGFFWAAELTLLVIVIDRTWRRTILEARDGRLVLRFSGLFGTREHRWPFDQIGDVAVVPTQEAVGAYALAELHFRATDDVPVHLYTDHRADEVLYIQSLLSRILRHEPAAASAAASVAQPVAAIPIQPPDGKMVSHLVDVRKTIRQREVRVTDSPP
jgi:hypothetical protein